MCESYAFFYFLTDFMVEGKQIWKLISKIPLLMNDFDMAEMRLKIVFPELLL